MAECSFIHPGEGWVELHRYVRLVSLTAFREASLSWCVWTGPHAGSIWLHTAFNHDLETGGGWAGELESGSTTVRGEATVRAGKGGRKKSAKGAEGADGAEGAGGGSLPPPRSQSLGTDSWASEAEPSAPAWATTCARS